MAPYQHGRKHQQYNYDDDPQSSVPLRIRAVSRKLMVAIDDGMLACVNSQKESPSFAPNRSKL
jgi:hypothetical protein